MMQAGRFDSRVLFERKVRVPDGGGGYLTEWHEMPGGGRRWAAVWPAGQNKSDQEVSAARVANAVDYKLTVRTDRATRRVTSDWRVLLDGRPCAIKSVTRPDRGRGTITMIIQEGQPT